MATRDIPQRPHPTARALLATMVALGAVAAVLTGTLGAWAFAAVVGWDAAAIAFTGWSWFALIIPMGAAETAKHATRENPGKRASELIIVIAAVASLAGVGVLLTQATASTGTSRDLLAVLGVASVALSWFVVNTLYTLRYASLYSRGAPGGIDFNQKAPPRYVDFAYVAFTVGMTFQVSDTDLETTAVRANALRQGLLAYLFGAVVLATTINLVVSLATT